MLEVDQDLISSATFRDVMRNPTRILSGLRESLSLWFRSRRWGQIAVSCLAIIGVIGVYVFYSFASEQETWKRELVGQYRLLAQKLVPMTDLTRQLTSRLESSEQVDNAPQVDPATEQSLQKLRIVLTRVLREDPDDAVALFIEGLTKAVYEDLDSGMATIERLAAMDQVDLPPAHAVVAAKLFQRFQRGEVGVREDLLFHLGIASKWTEVSPHLLSLYARLAETPKQKEEAIDMLEVAAARNPDLFLQLAQATRRSGRETPARLAAEKALKHHETMIASGRGRLEDWTSAADALLLLNKFAEARSKLEDALLQPGLDRAQLKHHLSNILRAEYQASLLSKDSQEGPRLGLLETAADLDPNNELIAEDVSAAIGRGVVIPDRLRKLLQMHVQNGTATVATYFSLSNEYVARERFQEAISSLEKALEKEPNQYMVLNNLALLIARHRPDEIQRALTLVEKAGRLAPNNMEIIDTWGEVLLLANQPMEAIAKLTASLSANPSRTRTRELLVQAYEMADLPDMAKVYRDRLEAMKKNNR